MMEPSPWKASYDGGHDPWRSRKAKPPPPAFSSRNSAWPRNGANDPSAFYLGGRAPERPGRGVQRNYANGGPNPPLKKRPARVDPILTQEGRSQFFKNVKKLLVRLSVTGFHRQQLRDNGRLYGKEEVSSSDPRWKRSASLDSSSAPLSGLGEIVDERMIVYFSRAYDLPVKEVINIISLAVDEKRSSFLKARLGRRGETKARTSSDPRSARPVKSNPDPKDEQKRKIETVPASSSARTKDSVEIVSSGRAGIPAAIEQAQSTSLPQKISSSSSAQVKSVDQRISKEERETAESVKQDSWRSTDPVAEKSEKLRTQQDRPGKPRRDVREEESIRARDNRPPAEKSPSNPDILASSKQKWPAAVIENEARSKGNLASKDFAPKDEPILRDSDKLNKEVLSSRGQQSASSGKTVRTPEQPKVEKTPSADLGRNFPGWVETPRPREQIVVVKFVPSSAQKRSSPEKKGPTLKPPAKGETKDSVIQEGTTAQQQPIIRSSKSVEEKQQGSVGPRIEGTIGISGRSPAGVERPAVPVNSGGKEEKLTDNANGKRRDDASDVETIEMSRGRVLKESEDVKTTGGNKKIADVEIVVQSRGGSQLPDVKIVEARGKSQLPSDVKIVEARGKSQLPDVKIVEARGKSQLADVKIVEARGKSRLPDVEIIEVRGKSQLPDVKIVEARGKSQLPDVEIVERRGKSQLPDVKIVEARGKSQLPDEAATLSVGEKELRRSDVVERTKEKQMSSSEKPAASAAKTAASGGVALVKGEPRVSHVVERNVGKQSVGSSETTAAPAARAAATGAMQLTKAEPLVSQVMERSMGKQISSSEKIAAPAPAVKATAPDGERPTKEAGTPVKADVESGPERNRKQAITEPRRKSVQAREASLAPQEHQKQYGKKLVQETRDRSVEKRTKDQQITTLKSGGKTAPTSTPAVDETDDSSLEDMPLNEFREKAKLGIGRFDRGKNAKDRLQVERLEASVAQLLSDASRREVKKTSGAKKTHLSTEGDRKVSQRPSLQPGKEQNPPKRVPPPRDAKARIAAPAGESADQTQPVPGKPGLRDAEEKRAGRSNSLSQGREGGSVEVEDRNSAAGVQQAEVTVDGLLRDRKTSGELPTRTGGNRALASPESKMSPLQATESKNRDLATEKTAATAVKATVDVPEEVAKPPATTAGVQVQPANRTPDPERTEKVSEVHVSVEKAPVTRNTPEVPTTRQAERAAKPSNARKSMPMIAPRETPADVPQTVSRVVKDVATAVASRVGTKGLRPESTVGAEKPRSTPHEVATTIRAGAQNIATSAKPDGVASRNVEDKVTAAQDEAAPTARSSPAAKRSSYVAIRPAPMPRESGIGRSGVESPGNGSVQSIVTLDLEQEKRNMLQAIDEVILENESDEEMEILESVYANVLQKPAAGEFSIAQFQSAELSSPKGTMKQARLNVVAKLNLDLSGLAEDINGVQDQSKGVPEVEKKSGEGENAGGGQHADPSRSSTMVDDLQALQAIRLKGDIEALKRKRPIQLEDDTTTEEESAPSDVPGPRVEQVRKGGGTGTGARNRRTKAPRERKAPAAMSPAETAKLKRRKVVISRAEKEGKRSTAAPLKTSAKGSKKPDPPPATRAARPPRRKHGRQEERNSLEGKDGPRTAEDPVPSSMGSDDKSASKVRKKGTTRSGPATRTSTAPVEREEDGAEVGKKSGGDGGDNTGGKVDTVTPPSREKVPQTPSNGKKRKTSKGESGSDSNLDGSTKRKEADGMEVVQREKAGGEEGKSNDSALPPKPETSTKSEIPTKSETPTKPETPMKPETPAHGAGGKNGQKKAPAQDWIYELPRGVDLSAWIESDDGGEDDDDDDSLFGSSNVDLRVQPGSQPDHSAHEVTECVELAIRGLYASVTTDANELKDLKRCLSISCGCSPQALLDITNVGDVTLVVIPKALAEGFRKAVENGNAGSKAEVLTNFDANSGFTVKGDHWKHLTVIAREREAVNRTLTRIRRQRHILKDERAIMDSRVANGWEKLLNDQQEEARLRQEELRRRRHV